jgi:hydrogenase nickel incorporation protein HypA/HybF
MHELPIIKSIFDICMKHAKANDASRIFSVTLKVGDATDLQDEWIQRYFDYLCKGTMAEGAKLTIERVPFVIRCKKCSESFQVNIREQRQVECPKCKGKDFAYVSGREYRVENMEVA